MIAFALLSILAVGPALTQIQPDPDPYGKDGPCAYLFKIPGGECMHGTYELELQIDPEKHVSSAKVVSTFTDADSTGPVDQVAQCEADNVAFYWKRRGTEADKPGIVRKKVNVVNFRCKKSNAQPALQVGR